MRPRSHRPGGVCTTRHLSLTARTIARSTVLAGSPSSSLPAATPPPQASFRPIGFRGGCAIRRPASFRSSMGRSARSSSLRFRRKTPRDSPRRRLSRGGERSHRFVISHRKTPRDFLEEKTAKYVFEIDSGSDC